MLEEAKSIETENRFVVAQSQGMEGGGLSTDWYTHRVSFLFLK